MSIAVINSNTNLWVTDELTTAFFECPLCEFSRVPYVGLPYQDLNKEDAQTQFCPHCGAPIEWVSEGEEE